MCHNNGVHINYSYYLLGIKILYILQGNFFYSVLYAVYNASS